MERRFSHDWSVWRFIPQIDFDVAVSSVQWPDAAEEYQKVFSIIILAGKEAFGPRGSQHIM